MKSIIDNSKIKVGDKVCVRFKDYLSRHRNQWFTRQTDMIVEEVNSSSIKVNGVKFKYRKTKPLTYKDDWSLSEMYPSEEIMNEYLAYTDKIETEKLRVEIDKIYNDLVDSRKDFQYFTGLRDILKNFGK